MTCARAFTIERWVAGELDAEKSYQLQSHLSQCSSCQAFHESLLLDAEAFSQEISWAAFEDQHRARRERKTAKTGILASLVESWRQNMAGWSLGTGLVASACAVLFMLQPTLPDTSPNGDFPRTRTKGASVDLRFSVNEGATLRPGVNGETLKPGSRIQIAYQTVRPHLAIFGIDGSSEITSYFPEGELSHATDKQSGVIPFLFELDETPGDERFVGVFCSSPFALSDASRALAMRNPELNTAPSGELLPGCETSMVFISKETRPRDE